MLLIVSGGDLWSLSAATSIGFASDGLNQRFIKASHFKTSVGLNESVFSSSRTLKQTYMRVSQAGRFRRDIVDEDCFPFFLLALQQHGQIANAAQKRFHASA